MNPNPACPKDACPFWITLHNMLTCVHVCAQWLTRHRMALQVGLLALVASGASCVATPDMFKSASVRAGKNILGSYVEVPTDASVQGLSFERDPSTGKMFLKLDAANSSASTVNASLEAHYKGYLQGMAVAGEQQIRLSETNWAGANQLTGQITAVLGPIFASKYQADMAKAARPSQMNALLGLVANGQVDASALPGDILADLRNHVGTLLEPSAPSPPQ